MYISRSRSFGGSHAVSSRAAFMNAVMPSVLGILFKKNEICDRAPRALPNFFHIITVSSRFFIWKLSIHYLFIVIKRSGLLPTHHLNNELTGSECPEGHTSEAALHTSVQAACLDRGMYRTRGAQTECALRGNSP